MKTTTAKKPSLGTAINQLLGAADEAVMALDDNGAEEQAKTLRDAAGKVRAALKAAQPPRDAKADAKAAEELAERDLDARLARDG